MYTEPSQENEDPKKWPGRKFLYLLDKEVIKLWSWQIKGVWGRDSKLKGKEVTRKIGLVWQSFFVQISWPQIPSLVIRMSSLLLVQGGDLSHASVMTPFRIEVWSRGGSQWPSCFCHLKKKMSFNLRYLICQAAILYGSVSWTPVTCSIAFVLWYNHIF